MVAWIPPFFTKPTTPGGWSVIAWTTILVLALAGFLALYASFQVINAQHAAVLRRIGLSTIGLAILLWIAKRATVWFVD